MCGRFVRHISIPEIAEAFDAEPSGITLKKSYNIAPSQYIAIIINDGKNRLVQCKWGFVPHWAKEATVSYKMINARSETVAQKSSYKNAFRKQRCLIVANGFYEWRKEGKAKIPVYIYIRTRTSFGFAGLFNTWTSPEGEQTCTSTIITTLANSLLKTVHDRMPVIISRENEKIWLDPSRTDEESLHQLLGPYPSEEMAFDDVSTMVNSPSHDTPDCIKPVHRT